MYSIFHSPPLGLPLGLQLNAFHPLPHSQLPPSTDDGRAARAPRPEPSCVVTITYCSWYMVHDYMVPDACACSTGSSSLLIVDGHSCLVTDCGRARMSSDYFCSRHRDKGKRVSWKVGKGLFTLLYLLIRRRVPLQVVLWHDIRVCWMLMRVLSWLHEVVRTCPYSVNEVRVGR